MQTASLLWQTLSVPWLIPWLFAFNLFFSLPGLGNTILYPHQGPSIWCTKFKWQDEVNGAMVVTEGQKLYFKLTAMSSVCDCGKNPGCNRLENAFCEYSFEAECGACRPCTIYSQTTIPFYPRNSGHPKLLRLDGVANQVTEPIDIASCKVTYDGKPGSFSGFCWYSNSQASLQPFYTYILTSGGPIMESIVWTTLMAGAVSVSITTADWMSMNNTFQVGEKAMLKVTQRDAYGNPVSSITVLNVDCFKFTGFVSGDSKAKSTIASQAVKYECDKSGDGTGYIYWYPSNVGKLWLQVGSGGTNIRGSPFPFEVTPGPISIKTCTALWPNSVNTFMAGDTSTLQVLQKDTRGNAYAGKPYSFLTRASTRASGVYIPLTFDVKISADGIQLISFVPTQAGEFLMYVGNFEEQISGSPFPFKVLPGQINVSSCTGAWKYTQEFGAGSFKLMIGKGLQSIHDSPFVFVVSTGPISVAACKAQWVNDINQFKAGATATLTIIVTDKYGNEFNTSFPFIISVHKSSGLKASNVVMEVNRGSDESYTTVDLIVKEAGSYYVTVGTKKQFISNSPLLFSVSAGVLSLRHSSGGWLDDVNEFQPPGMARFYLVLKDSAGNILNDSYASIHNISIEVYDSSGVPLPNPDMQINYVQNPSRYIVSFTMSKFGQFALGIGKGVDHLAGSPFQFYFIAGDVDPAKTVIVGNGLDNSTAGEVSTFSVQLRDNHGNPTGASNTSIIISILRFGDQLELPKNITSNSTMIGFYNVSFIAKISGQYAITIRWRGVTLNSGPALYKTVFPGLPDRERSILTGNGLNNSYAGDFSSFLIKARDQAGNPVIADISLLNVTLYSKSLPALIVNTSLVQGYPGTFVITYATTMAGNYTILVRLMSVPLYEGHKYVFAGPIFFPKCKAIGSGLQGGYAGQPLSFIVVPYDEYNNVNLNDNVTVSLSLTPNVTTAVQVSRNDSGIFVFRYSIFVAQTYFLNIVGQTQTAELSVPGSPFEITVIAGAVNMSQSQVSGFGLSVLAAVNITNDIGASLIDSYGNLQNVEENLLSLTISPSLNTSVQNFFYMDVGQYQASYKVLKPGLYNISAKYNGSHFDGSPFEVLVTSDAWGVLPQNCAAEVLSPISSAGEKVKVLIKVYDANGNYFVPHVKLSFAINLKPRLSDKSYNYLLEDYGNGTFTATYEIYVAGAYVLLISVFGTLIKNNPYPLSILPALCKQSS